MPGNDVRSDSVTVIIRTTDAGVARILAPADTVDSGAIVAPQALVRNYGLTTVSFPVQMRLGNSYADTQQVTDLAAGDSVPVLFGDYTVPRRGNTNAICNTLLTGDQDPANDTARKVVFRRVRDAGVRSIVAPTGVVEPGTIVSPVAAVRNFGNVADTFMVTLRVGTFYADTAFSAGETMTFRPCTLNIEGTFSVVCSTEMAGDMNPANDAAYDSVQVVYVGISGPEPLGGIPRTVTLRSPGFGPSARQVAIVYGLPMSADVRLEVHDACGRFVRVLATGAGLPGYHTAVWQFTDERDRAVPEGAYFVRLTAGGVTLTSKVVKMD
jgi:hypothetical protein